MEGAENVPEQSIVNICLNIAFGYILSPHTMGINYQHYSIQSNGYLNNFNVIFVCSVFIFIYTLFHIHS